MVDSNTATVTLTVTAGGPGQVISFGALPDVSFGIAPFMVSASASSGLPVKFSSKTATVCKVTTTTVTLLNVGTCTIAADQAGDATFHAAPEVTRSFSITKGMLTVVANNKSRVYGSANPALNATILNKPTTGVTGAPACSTSALNTSDIGSYAIVCTTGTLASTKYDFTFVDGTLSIAPKLVTVKVTNIKRAYGTANPAFKLTYTGLVLHQTLATSGISGTPDCSTPADALSVPGIYLITCELGTLQATDYVFTIPLGQVTVVQAKLKVVSTHLTRPYGDPNPELVVTYTGFVNGESLATSDVAGRRCARRLRRSRARRARTRSRARSERSHRRTTRSCSSRTR